MPEQFHQYYLIKTLSKKYSHASYLASPTNPQRGHGEPQRHVVLTMFAQSLFQVPHEHEHLLQKVQRMKQLEHQHLLPILDMGMEAEQPFVVREYLPNGSLRDRLKKISPDRMELQEALTIVLQVGEALAYAYEHNVSHGNVRPENVLFDASGRIVLTDFYLLGRRKDVIIRDQAAQEYAFCYMAPEQFAGISDVKSDQYALGCLAYELITGQVPFAAQTLASMMGQHNNAPPAPLSESVTSLLPSLEMAILKALAKDPTERFFDFSLFLEIVQSALLPSPPFPFAHSPSNKALPHPEQLAEARDISSIGNYPAPSHFMSQLQEASEAFANPEVDVAEPIDTFSISQASSPEWAGILPISESLESALLPDQFSFPLPGQVYPVSDRGPKQEADGLVTSDTVDDAGEKPLPLRKSSDKDTSESVQPVHNRGKALRLMVLFSLIGAAIASAFWVARMPTLITRSPSTKNMMQVVDLTETANRLTARPSMQATNVPIVPIAQTLVQPSIQATSIPIVQPSSPPTIAPTPSPPVSYDASDSRNTLANGARLVNCSECSSGSRVGYIGLNAGEAGTLQFNNVSKNVAGKYTLTIYYIIAGADKLTMYISVNGESAVVLNVADTPNGDTVGTASISISLNAGNNTIAFSNPSEPAPDMDRIVV